MFKQKSNQEFFPFSQTTAANLRNDLGDLFGVFSGDAAENGALVDFVILKYSEKHRFYHNLSHVNYLLCSAENIKHKFNDYDGVRLAIWFHDVIYEPRSLKNEAASASVAVERLTKLNVSPTIIEKVKKMILATTRHDAAGLDDDGQMFLDLDLSILGTSGDVYRKYTQAIRYEYSFVPQILFRYRRAKILKSFLGRQFIYFTDDLREKYEAAARRNVADEIKELS